jgi:hypothetical protein
MTALASTAHADIVSSAQKISDLEGGFSGELSNVDVFGDSIAALGDLSGDGTVEVAVGTQLDDDGGDEAGAVWILSLDSDGTVDSEVKISDTSGGMEGNLDSNDRFGVSVSNLGDVNGDGVTDIAVGTYLDDDGGPDRGAVWILFLDTDGTVESFQKISSTQGEFAGTIDDYDYFGVGVEGLGDFDHDGVPDLAVGATRDDDGGTNFGAVWLLFLNSDGTVKSHQKISTTEGFGSGLSSGQAFGARIAAFDVDGNGTKDLALGTNGDSDTGSNVGAVWIVFLECTGTVLGKQKINEVEGGFTGSLDPSDEFGSDVTAIGDYDLDGVPDLAVGAHHDDDGGTNRGAIWILYLEADGTVKSHSKLSDTSEGLGSATTLENSDAIGVGLDFIGDLDGDGVGDLAVGARGDDDGGTDRGAVWILFLSAHSLPLRIAGEIEFRSGDANGDGALNISDPIQTIGHLFDRDIRLACERAADVDDSGFVSLLDALALLEHLFLGSAARGALTEDCRQDTLQVLSCEGTVCP